MMSSKVGFLDSLGKDVVSAGICAECGGRVGYVRTVASDGQRAFVSLLDGGSKVLG